MSIASIADQVRAFLAANPMIVKFLRDAAEGSVAAVGALALTLPASLPDAQKEAVVIFTAVAGATIAVARRELLPIIFPSN